MPAPIPSTGEPEDIINEVPILEVNTEVGSYFEIILLNESGYPSGGKPTKICPTCKREDVNYATREIRMTKEMWKGQSIFLLATTLYVVISDQLKEQLEQFRPTNVVFENI